MGCSLLDWQSSISGGRLKKHGITTEENCLFKEK
jgi:hypothetical protein